MTLQRLLICSGLLAVSALMAACGGGGGGGIGGGAIISYTVTPAAGAGGSITPATPQSVPAGATKQFTISANSGYQLVTPVGGTCPQGTLTGASYTTGAITGDCSVAPAFILKPYQTLKLGFSGTLPAGTAISGGEVVVLLPNGVTLPTDTNGALTASAVAFSGAAAGKLLFFQKEYLQSPARLKFTFYSNEAQGYRSTGEFASVTYANLSDGPVLPADFTVSGTIVNLSGVNIDSLTTVAIP